MPTGRKARRGESVATSARRARVNRQLLLTEEEFQPKIESQIVPGFIHQVRAHLVLVYFTQLLRVERHMSGQVLNVFPVLRAIAFEFRQRQIIGVEYLQLYVGAEQRKDFPKTLLVILGQVADSDVLEVDAVFF